VVHLGWGITSCHDDDSFKWRCSDFWIREYDDSGWIREYDDGRRVYNNNLCTSSVRSGNSRHDRLDVRVRGTELTPARKMGSSAATVGNTDQSGY
jgi:hypothetical protein